MSNGKASKGSGVCERLDRIEEMLTPPQASPEAYAVSRRNEDRAAWWEAYCAAITGLLAHHGDAQSDDLAARICQAHADAAIAARKARWDATQKDGSE